MSDHFLVEARLKMVEGWRSAGKIEGVRSVLKVSELNKSMKGMKISSIERWVGQDCGEGVGKVQRYSGVQQ